MAKETSLPGRTEAAISAARQLVGEKRRKKALKERGLLPIRAREKTPTEIASEELKKYLQREEVKPAATTIQALLLALMNASESRPYAPIRVFAVNNPIPTDYSPQNVRQPILLILTAATTDGEKRRIIMEESVQETLETHARNQNEWGKHRPLTQLPTRSVIGEDFDQQNFFLTPAEFAALNGTVRNNATVNKTLRLPSVTVNYCSERFFNPVTAGDPIVQVFSSLDDPNTLSYKDAQESGEIICISEFSVDTLGIYMGSLHDPGPDY